MGFNKKTAVICDFNKDEERGFEMILALAENNLSTTPMSKSDNWLTTVMIQELRRVFVGEE